MTAASAPRRPSARRASTIRALKEAQALESMSAIVLTPDGHALMTERLHQLRDVTLAQLVPLLAERDRDERDTAEYERLLTEVLSLESTLASSIIAPAADAGCVQLGSRVFIEMPDGERLWVRPVHPVEASLDGERISATSPLSQALMGVSAGDSVVVDGPTEAWRCLVVDVGSVGDQLAASRP